MPHGVWQARLRWLPDIFHTAIRRSRGPAPGRRETPAAHRPSGLFCVGGIRRATGASAHPAAIAAWRKYAQGGWRVREDRRRGGRETLVVLREQAVQTHGPRPFPEFPEMHAVFQREEQKLRLADQIFLRHI